MTTPINERDLLMLNLYLDGDLSSEERFALEQRLRSEQHLKTELETLRATVALIGMAERIRAPRSFTLDPAIYGKKVRRSFWLRLQAAQPAIWATAGATLLTTLICSGLIVFNLLGMGITGAQNAAMEAAYAEPAEAPVMELEAMDAEGGEIPGVEAPAPGPEATAAAAAPPGMGEADMAEEASAAEAPVEEEPTDMLAGEPAEEPAEEAAEEVPSDEDAAAAGEVNEQPAATPAPLGTPPQGSERSTDDEGIAADVAPQDDAQMIEEAPVERPEEPQVWGGYARLASVFTTPVFILAGLALTGALTLLVLLASRKRPQ